MRILYFSSVCILTLVFFTASTFPAQAQLIRGYGIKAGVTSSNVRSQNFDLEQKRRTGIGFSAFVEWLDASPLSIVTEAGYVQRGFAVEYEARDAEKNAIGTLRFDDRFDYLSFATHAKARWPNGALSPYVLGGPHFDVLLSGHPDEEGSLSSFYSATAFGGTLGAGVEFSQRLPVNLFTEIRYSFDLTNSLPDVPRDAYNNTFEVLLGVRL